MILLCGDGLTAIEVSQRLSKRLGSIQKWRKRYLELGLSGLEDQPRSGRPRRLSPSKVRKVLKATVQTIPRESTHWSLRLMAEYAQVSKHQVTAIWKAADLKPHQVAGQRYFDLRQGRKSSKIHRPMQGSKELEDPSTNVNNRNFPDSALVRS